MKLDFDRLVQVGLRRGFEKVRRVVVPPPPTRNARARTEPIDERPRRAPSNRPTDRPTDRGYVSPLGGQAK
jgi:hypothetical protein